MSARNIPRLIGMVHLGPLPEAPGFGGDLGVVVDGAVADATALEQAGFPALIVENYGDAPFYADDVPKVTVAAMTTVVAAVRSAVSIAVGVNVLRNDALAGLAIAAVTRAQMIRVNVLSGTMHTDQGPITGKAAGVARLRAAVAPDVAVLADVFVKHATPPPGLSLPQAAEDTLVRAGADALVVTGPGTGQAPDLDEVRSVVEVAGASPVLVGSGASADGLGEILAVAHGAIVGTSIKRDGITAAPVDPRRAAEVVAAYRDAAP